jgi:hypothetical protein
MHREPAVLDRGVTLVERDPIAIHDDAAEHAAIDMVGMKPAADERGYEDSARQPGP